MPFAFWFIQFQIKLMNCGVFFPNPEWGGTAELKRSWMYSYACGLKRLDSWRQCVAIGCDGRFKAWGGGGTPKNITSIKILFVQVEVKMSQFCTYRELPCSQTVRTQSSVELAERQAGSLDQFLLRDKVSVHLVWSVLFPFYTKDDQSVTLPKSIIDRQMRKTHGPFHHKQAFWPTEVGRKRLQGIQN